VIPFAVARVTEAVKMNYEIHGNTLPHLHMHFFPRRRGDPFEDRAIDSRRVKSPVYARDEHRAYVDALTSALREG
jgi:diadenosine tetraphosphate (Ap4A) HIT family hydrolase